MMGFTTISMGKRFSYIRHIDSGKIIAYTSVNK